MWVRNGAEQEGRGRLTKTKDKSAKRKLKANLKMYRV